MFELCTIEPFFQRWNIIEEGYFDGLAKAYQKIRRARTTIFDSMVKVNILYESIKMNIFIFLFSCFEDLTRKVLCFFQLRGDFLALLKQKSHCQEIFDEYQVNL